MPNVSVCQDAVAKPNQALNALAPATQFVCTWLACRQIFVSGHEMTILLFQVKNINHATLKVCVFHFYSSFKPRTGTVQYYYQ